MPEKYDLIIIGAGPGGMSSAIYAVRQGLKVLVLEAKAPGGQMLTTTHIENYPGYETITGPELAEHMKKQVESLGAELKLEEVVNIEKNETFKLTTKPGNKYEATALILATGATHRKLGIPGEAEFSGKGVSYCATCDAPFFKGKATAVIGGGNSAIDAALLLDELASKVYIVHRRNQFRASEALVKKLESTKVEKLMDSVCEEIKGDKTVTAIVVKNTKSNEKKEIKVDGVFIDIGIIPVTALANKIGVKVNESGYVDTSRSQETNVPGVFAIGDLTGGLRQIITSAGEGAIAAISAYKHIAQKTGKGKDIVVIDWGSKKKYRR